MMASIFIGRINDAMALSVFGVSNTILTMLFIVVVKGMSEATAMKTSYFYTNNRDREMGEYFYKGIFLYVIVYSVFLFISLTSQQWLTFIDLE